MKEALLHEFSAFANYPEIPDCSNLAIRNPLALSRYSKWSIGKTFNMYYHFLKAKEHKGVYTGIRFPIWEFPYRFSRGPIYFIAESPLLRCEGTGSFFERLKLIAIYVFSCPRSNSVESGGISFQITPLVVAAKADNQVEDPQLQPAKMYPKRPSDSSRGNYHLYFKTK